MWSSVIDLIVLSPKRQEQKGRRMIHKVIISWDDEEYRYALTWEDFMREYILDEMHRCIDDMDLSEETINHAHGIVNKIMLHLNTYVEAEREEE